MSEHTTRPFVVVPCLNEERVIGRLLRGVLARCPDVIVVDDGSDDGTAEIAAQLPVTLLRHAQRRGKGEALRTGFREALRRGASGVLTMDGDGQHDPADIPRLMAAARRFPDALIVGARMLDRDRQPGARRRANAFADWGIGWGCAQPVADTQSGQRWYPRPAMDLVDLATPTGPALPAQGFVFEAALLILASRELGMPVVSVPIACRYEAGARHSHFRPVRDVLRITWYTFWRVVHYGHVVRAYRRSRASAPRVYDPDGRLAAEPARADAPRAAPGAGDA